MITTLYTTARATRIAAARLVRARIATAHDTFTTRALRARGLVTVTQVLAALGADADFTRRYASHAGKKIKAAHLAAYGTTPAQAWKVINGHTREVFAYPAGEPVLREGLAAYERTAHLVAV